MLFENTYHAIEKPAEGIFCDRGSKFLAYASQLSVHPAMVEEMKFDPDRKP